MPAMGSKSREVMWGGQIMGASAPGAPAKLPRKPPVRQIAPRFPRVVGSNGRLRRARAAVADHPAMPQRLLGLAGGRVQSL
jgi:hypothetical protein